MPEPALLQFMLNAHGDSLRDRVAVLDERCCLTYGDLDAYSNRLAHCLQAIGVRRQDNVIILMQRSVHCLTAMLGVLKADAIYIPIDTRSQNQRLNTIIADCLPRAIIYDSATFQKFGSSLTAAFDARSIILDENQAVPDLEASFHASWPDILSCSEMPPVSQNQPRDLAYIMYTSGSTGKPKGVMISHVNIHTYIKWAVDYFSLGPEDRILGTAPFHFDMSTFDVHATLMSGSTLCVASDAMMLFPEKLLRFVEEHKVTVWKGVSSLLMYLARAGVLAPERMPSLSTVVFAGEPLPTRYLMQWMQTYPKKRFVNAYGPTEATGISLYHRVDTPPKSVHERIPIGKPCAETEVFLVNKDLSPTKDGDVGELCISGPCLARGYLNDPLKTEEVFVEPGPAGESKRYYRTGDLAIKRSDGSFEYLARKDNQVKVMGYRIELEEIEHALYSIGGIDDVVVVVESETHSGLQELAAYYESAVNLPPSAILQEIKKLLPAYMVPKRYTRVDKLPRNERGKIVRNSHWDNEYEMVMP